MTRTIATRAAPVVFVLALAGACRDEPFSEPEVLGGEEVSAQLLNRGHDLYARYCVTCHGVRGDGKGPAAVGMRPAPRDFRTATFKFAGAADQTLPHDDELVRIVRDGLAGTAMRAWDLHEREIRSIVQYIKTFSPPEEGFRDPSREVSRPEIPPDPYEGREDAGVAEGEQIFHTVLQCNQCHPSYVPRERFDAWEFPVPRPEGTYRPAPRYSSAYDAVLVPDDFLRHPFRSVRLDGAGRLRGDDLYRVIAYGLQGPMPGFGHLDAETIWAVVYYVRFLAELRGTDAGEQLLRRMASWGD
jgi:mono/diheme cytochrome c family protein